jgi:hypothetical protein
MPRYEGMCLGGPRNGKRLVSNSLRVEHIRTIRPPPLPITSVTLDLPNVVVGAYHFDRIMELWVWQGFSKC